MGGSRSCDEGGGWHPALESTQGDGWAEFEELMFFSSEGEAFLRQESAISIFALSQKHAAWTSCIILSHLFLWSKPSSHQEKLRCHARKKHRNPCIESESESAMCLKTKKRRNLPTNC